FTMRYRLDRRTGGHEAEQRQFHSPRTAGGRKDFNGATLVVAAPDVALSLQVREMFVDRGERVIVELRGDFLETGRIPVARGILGEEVEDFALPPGERHGCPWPG